MSFFSRSLFCVVLSHGVASAQSVPPLMNYQGQISDANGQAINGQKSLIFRVYDVPTGGTAIWGPQAITADVTNGYFNVVLGSDSTGGDSIATAFAGHPRYVSVSVNPVGQSSAAEILPRQQVLSAPYAMEAGTADHGALRGLADDDHPQYLLGTEINVPFIESSSANMGIYDNRIAEVTLTVPFTEVCFAGGVQKQDVHAAGESTVGGNCAVGDRGWVIERDERGPTFWVDAKGVCLMRGMRLPEAFEFQWSCINATGLGLNSPTNNHEWISNQAFPFSAAGEAGTGVSLQGNGSCAAGAVGWISRNTPLNQTAHYRCVR